MATALQCACTSSGAHHRHCCMSATQAAAADPSYRALSRKRNLESQTKGRIVQTIDDRQARLLSTNNAEPLYSKQRQVRRAHSQGDSSCQHITTRQEHVHWRDCGMCILQLPAREVGAACCTACRCCGGQHQHSYSCCLPTRVLCPKRSRARTTNVFEWTKTHWSKCCSACLSDKRTGTLCSCRCGTSDH